MIVVGLTGSIAMGKSETARMFAAAAIPVFDSDAAVHALYAKGGAAVEAIRQIAPECVVDDAVDRSKLTELLKQHPELIRRIEAIVHPMVIQSQKAFLAEVSANGGDIAVLDIPLLYEAGREKDVDVVIVVSAGSAIQRERALARPSMTPEKFDFILSRQMPDVEKRMRADYVVDTSMSLAATAREVDRIIAELKQRGAG